MKSELIDFCLLQSRLLVLLRERIQAGEFTERHLARISGISQPHVHNVLKGVRELTPAVADRLLHCLSWSVPDLLDDLEMVAVIDDRTGRLIPECELRVLNHRVGPGCAWPSEPSRFERLAVHADLVRDYRNPVAARLAVDPEMSGAFESGDTAILDLTEVDDRTPLAPKELFLVAMEGEARLRWLRWGAHHLYLLSTLNQDRPDRWQPVESRRVTIAGRARISGKRTPLDVPRRPPGTVPAPERRYVAS